MTAHRLMGRLEALESALQGLRGPGSEGEFGRLLHRGRQGRCYFRQIPDGCALTWVGAAGPLTYEVIGVDAL